MNDNVNVGRRIVLLFFRIPCNDANICFTTIISKTDKPDHGDLENSILCIFGKERPNEFAKVQIRCGTLLNMLNSLDMCPCTVVDVFQK